MFLHDISQIFMFVVNANQPVKFGSHTQYTALVHTCNVLMIPMNKKVAQ